MKESSQNQIMRQRILLVCGVAAPLVFLFLTVLGGAMRPGYSHLADTISELFSSGAPDRPLLSAIFVVYALLMAGFGVGMLRLVERSGQAQRVGTIAAWLFIVAGLVSISMATVFPQDPWGSAHTTAGLMHMVLSGITGLLQVLSFLLLGIWFRRTGTSSRLATHSTVTAGLALLSAVAFMVMTGTSLMGLAERISALIGLQWTFVIAVWMLTAQPSRAD